MDWHGTQKEKYTAVVDTRDMGLAQMNPDVLFDVLLGYKKKLKPLQIKFVTFQSYVISTCFDNSIKIIE